MSGQKKRVKNYNRYPESLKRKIAKSYLKGEASYRILAQEHGLRNGSVVKEFVKWYRGKLSKEPNFDKKPLEDEMSKLDRKLTELSSEELESRIKALEKELRASELKTEMLETMIDIAEEELKIDIRKKSGTNQ